MLRLEGQFDICIDGLKAEALKLPGKPEPAVLLEIARRLDIQPSRAVLFEDALAGVESGKRGGFKCVVGIDHGKQRDALRQHGADVVIESLRQVHVEQSYIQVPKHLDNSMPKSACEWHQRILDYPTRPPGPLPPGSPRPTLTRGTEWIALARVSRKSSAAIIASTLRRLPFANDIGSPAPLRQPRYG